MTYIPYLGTFFFSRYPSVALARNMKMSNRYKLAAPRIVFFFGQHLSRDY